MTTYRLGFASSALQQAFDKCAPTLDAFTDSLDAMSNDIKMLEEALASRGIRVPYGARLTTDKFGRNCSVSLDWEEDDKSNRWRLILHKIWSPGIDETHDVRPLIETPAADRMVVYPFLANWLELLTAKVHVPSLMQHKLPSAVDETPVEDTGGL